MNSNETRSVMIAMAASALIVLSGLAFNGVAGIGQFARPVRTGPHESNVTTQDDACAGSGATDTDDAGPDIAVSALLEQQEYNVSFVEDGLTNGTLWSVSLVWSTDDSTINTTTNSTTDTIAFEEGNGNYTFSVGNASGLAPSPSAGFIFVNGSSVTVNTTFASCPSTSSGFDWSPVIVIVCWAAIVAVVVVTLVIDRRRTRPSPLSGNADSVPPC
jgi:hypothetical protein